MMGYDVDGEGDGARFLITHQGARLAATYGNEHVDPAERTNRYLDEAIGPERYARVVPSLSRLPSGIKRPAYSISTVQDADGKDVSYERLLMPFGCGERVEQIVGSFKSHQHRRRLQDQQPDGPEAESRCRVILVRAIIDRAIRAGSGRPAFGRRSYRTRLGLAARAASTPLPSRRSPA